MAYLALVSAPLPKVQGTSYWAYVPNPPIVQPVGWLDREPIKVLTNDSVRMGGAQDSDARVSSSSMLQFGIIQVLIIKDSYTRPFFRHNTKSSIDILFRDLLSLCDVGSLWGLLSQLGSQ